MTIGKYKAHQFSSCFTFLQNLREKNWKAMEALGKAEKLAEGKQSELTQLSAELQMAKKQSHVSQHLTFLLLFVTQIHLSSLVRRENALVSHTLPIIFLLCAPASNFCNYCLCLVILCSLKP